MSLCGMYTITAVFPGEERGGGVLPSSRLMEMSRWMGLHFHDRIDYNGAAFSPGHQSY